MDKYDQLLESARDYEEEDYFYEQLRCYGLGTKEEQIEAMWSAKKGRQGKLIDFL
jgi:hypothetical protein